MPADVLGGFARRIKARVDNVHRNLDRLLRKTALVVDQTVVMETPVDTGRARSNWLVSVDFPITEEIDAYLPGENGSTESQNTAEALRQGREAVREAVATSTIHITNNLPYIARLNDGWSWQAPAGYVDEAIAAGVASVRQAEGLFEDPTGYTETDATLGR